MNISIGNDHAGVDLKEAIVSYLQKKRTCITQAGPITVKVLTTQTLFIRRSGRRGQDSRYGYYHLWKRQWCGNDCQQTRKNKGGTVGLQIYPNYQDNTTTQIYSAYPPGLSSSEKAGRNGRSVYFHSF